MMLTNTRDAFRGQSRSPNIVPFDMLRYGFLLVCYSNLILKRRRFWDICLRKMSSRSKVTQVRRNDMDRSATYDFLLTFYDLISNRFRDKRRFQSKIANFSHPWLFCAPAEGVPVGIGYRRYGEKTGATGPTKKFDAIFSPVDTMNQRVGRTSKHRTTARTALTHSVARVKT